MIRLSCIVGLFVVFWAGVLLAASDMPAVVENANIANISETSGTTDYFGFQTRRGAWYIMAIADDGTVSYSYVADNVDYVFHWTNRAALSGPSRFQTFDEAF